MTPLEIVCGSLIVTIWEANPNRSATAKNNNNNPNIAIGGYKCMKYLDYLNTNHFIFPYPIHGLKKKGSAIAFDPTDPLTDYFDRSLEWGFIRI